MGNDKIKTTSHFDCNKLIYDLYEEMKQPEILKDMFYASDKPYKYKNILLYPITMDMCMLFHIFANCLTLMKNISGDINAIQKPYLDYLFYLAENGNCQYIALLEKLLFLVLRKNEIALNDFGECILTSNGDEIRTVVFVAKNGKTNIFILKDEINLPFTGINESNYYRYDSKDFDNIRKIICEQNGIELIDESIHPDKLKKIEEWEEFQAKKNNDKICSIEEQKAIIKIIKGWTTEEVDKMTIRSFYAELKRIGVLLDYNILNLLRPNMDKKDQKQIISWIGEVKKRSKLERITRDYGEFNDKFDTNKVNKK